MYYNDIMLCYGITEDELKTAYAQKFERNTKRRQRITPTRLLVGVILILSHQYYKAWFDKRNSSANWYRANWRRNAM